MSKELAHRVQNAFDRCKAFPEAGVERGNFIVRGDADLTLIELRNLCSEIVLALRESKKRRNPIGCQADASAQDRSLRGGSRAAVVTC